MGLRTLLAAALLLALTVLLSGQPAYAQVGSLYAPGTYPLLLQGQPKDLGGNSVLPLPKLMTLSISKDSKSLTFRFRWTHTPGPGASPDHFLFLAGFDLDGDGKWEDGDSYPFTIDDALIFWYLGYNIVTPPPCWICLNIQKGFRVISWDASDTFKEVTSGPLYPGGTTRVVFQLFAQEPSIADPSSPRLGKAYSYALWFTVPLDLFPGIGMSRHESGFAFGLIQETALKDGNHGLIWVWPPQLPGTDLGRLGNADGTGAALLGDLIWVSKRPR